MKFFVTGVNGQLGHDIMNELSSRSYEGIGSDIAPKYSGIQDDSPVTKMPFISLDITGRSDILCASGIDFSYRFLLVCVFGKVNSSPGSTVNNNVWCCLF